MTAKINTLMHPSPIKLLTHLFTGCAFFATTIAASAAVTDAGPDTPWYEIEVIIFAHTNVQAIDSEKWPDTLPSKNYEKIINLRFADDPSLYEDDTTPSFEASTLPPVTTAPKAGTTANAKIPAQIAVSKPKPIALPYVLLEPDDLRLREMADKLRLSKEVEPLLHIGWRQPTLDPENSLPVFVYDRMTLRGEDLANSFMMHESIPATDPATGLPVTREDMPAGQQASGYSVFGTANGQPVQGAMAPEIMTGPDYYRLSGTLRLSVSRYLHIESDLKLRLPVVSEETYTEPVVANAENDSETGSGFGSFFGVNQKKETMTWTEKHASVKTFRLAESRRLRSKEIHFLDHPLFGMIVQVIPFDAYPVEEVKKDIRKPAIPATL